MFDPPAAIPTSAGPREFGLSSCGQQSEHGKSCFSWWGADGVVVGLTALFALLASIAPIAGAFYRFEANYNEGWNAYNAQRLQQGLPLYGVKYGWTTVNYPSLSYFLISHLTWIAPDFARLGKLLSLLSFVLSAALVAAIMWKLTRRAAPVVFGVSFWVALLCTQATAFIGVDDPTLLANVFFLAGFLIYISKRDSLSFAWICLTVMLFIIAGNVKHNLIEYPLAVFVDLCLLSWRRAIQYLMAAVPLLVLSVYLNTTYGGSLFISNLLAPRSVSFSAIDFPPAYILPVSIAFFWGLSRCRGGNRRPCLALFLISLMVDLAFGTGVGVAVNIFVGNFFATSILMCLLVDSAYSSTPGSAAGFPQLWRAALPLVLCSPLLVSYVLSGQYRLQHELEELPQKQATFDAEVAFLKSHPGPALCESLLRCYDAGKSYVYDPFNATRFVTFHKLDPGVIVAGLDEHRYSAIQLDKHVEDVHRPSERFADPILDAIQRDYALALDDPGCAIYVPKR